MEECYLFYVSGHGWGHAVRTAEIIRRLAALRPSARILVRTGAPPELFEGCGGSSLRVREARLDAGAVEESPLAIDRRATLEAAAALLREAPAVVEAEAETIQREGVSLVAADVPFLAGPAAARAGVPCLAMSNFTWDWILEPYLGDFPDHAGTVERIRAHYAEMTAWIRMPLGSREPLLSRILDVPLVARPARLSREEVLDRIGVDRGDPRPRVLIGMRGGVPGESLVRAAAECPEVLFLYPGPLPVPERKNLRSIPVPGRVRFVDLMGACDAVLAKLGYGIVADALANGVGFLWVDRTGFREDDVVKREALPHLRAVEVRREEYLCGGWARAVRALLAGPPRPPWADSDGAGVCAGLLAEWR